MRKPIARIKINPGNPGWYDPLTNIHLTITRPEAIVFEGANTTNIKKGVDFKLVSVIDGSLDVNSTSVYTTKEVVTKVREVVPQPEKQVEVKEEIKPVETITEEVIEEVKVEETIAEPVEEKVEETITETVEETAEVVVEEEKPKKKSTRKTKTKKEEK